MWRSVGFRALFRIFISWTSSHLYLRSFHQPFIYFHPEFFSLLYFFYYLVVVAVGVAFSHIISLTPFISMAWPSCRLFQCSCKIKDVRCFISLCQCLSRFHLHLFDFVPLTKCGIYHINICQWFFYSVLVFRWFFSLFSSNKYSFEAWIRIWLRWKC